MGPLARLITDIRNRIAQARAERQALRRLVARHDVHLLADAGLIALDGPAEAPRRSAKILPFRPAVPQPQQPRRRAG